MALYILDGNILAELEDRQKPYFQAVRQQLTALTSEDRVAISVVSAYEYQHGIAKAKGELQEALRRTWSTFLDAFEILPLTLAGAAHYGKLRSRYEREMGATTRAANRHASDFLLAATALDNGAVLVSSDRIFQRLRELEPDFQIEDWREADL